MHTLIVQGLLKAMTRPNGVVSAYRAVMKREIDVYVRVVPFRTSSLLYMDLI